MNRIPLVLSVVITLLYEKFNNIIYGIVKEYPKFILRTISRHAKLPTPVDSDDAVLDKPNDNPGRPRKFTERDERSLVRPITIHNTHGISFTAGKLKNEGDLHVGDLHQMKVICIKHTV